jgi:hypothetical protein
MEFQWIFRVQNDLPVKLRYGRGKLTRISILILTHRANNLVILFHDVILLVPHNKVKKTKWSFSGLSEWCWCVEVSQDTFID